MERIFRCSCKVMPIVFVIDTRNHMWNYFENSKSKMNQVNEVVRELLKLGTQYCTTKYSGGEYNIELATEIDFCIFNLSGEQIVDWQPLSPYREYFTSLPEDNSKEIRLDEILEKVVDCIRLRKRLYYENGIEQAQPQIIVLSDFSMISSCFNPGKRTIAWLSDKWECKEERRLTFIVVKSNFNPEFFPDVLVSKTNLTIMKVEHCTPKWAEELMRPREILLSDEPLPNSHIFSVPDNILKKQ